jgi:hypothetical protein
MTKFCLKPFGGVFYESRPENKDRLRIALAQVNE